MDDELIRQFTHAHAAWDRLQVSSFWTAISWDFIGAQTEPRAADRPSQALFKGDSIFVINAPTHWTSRFREILQQRVCENGGALVSPPTAETIIVCPAALAAADLNEIKIPLQQLQQVRLQFTNSVICD